MQDDVLGLVQLPALVSIPGQFGSEAFSLHHVKVWNQLHHDVIRKIWKFLAHLQGHRYVQRECGLVDHAVISHHRFDHRQLPLLIHLIELQPIEDLAPSFISNIGHPFLRVTGT